MDFLDKGIKEETLVSNLQFFRNFWKFITAQK